MNMTSPNIKLVFFWCFSLALAESSFTFATPIFDNEPHRILKSLFPKTHIEIDNALGSGLQVNIHCESDLGADKGEHVINDGQSYLFEFTPSIIMQNYHCDISYNGGAVYANIYHYKRDWHRCFKHCKYRIALDGIHGYNQDGKDELLFNWDSHTSVQKKLL